MAFSLNYRDGKRSCIHSISKPQSIIFQTITQLKNIIIVIHNWKTIELYTKYILKTQMLLLRTKHVIKLFYTVLNIIIYVFFSLQTTQQYNKNISKKGLHKWAKKPSRSQQSFMFANHTIVFMIKLFTVRQCSGRLLFCWIVESLLRKRNFTNMAVFH